MVEQMPQFPGGPAELLKYIAKNLKYPIIAQENGIQGKVILRFVVNAKGYVEDIKVLRSLDPYHNGFQGNRTDVTYLFTIHVPSFLSYSNCVKVYEK